MKPCYHTTKNKHLSSILKNGLQPVYGVNSYLTADFKAGRISYSTGIQGAVKTFRVFQSFYNMVSEGRIQEDTFKKSLSPQDYARHIESVNSIKNASNFREWVADNIYLCFDGDYLSEKNEDKIEDSFTTQPIPPNQLKVCVIKNNNDNRIYSYSMVDIYSYFYAKNPDLEEGMGTYRFRNEINKFKSDEYSLEYIDLDKFCEMFPELLEGNNLNTRPLSLNEIGKGTIGYVVSDPKRANEVFNVIEKGVSASEKINEGETQEKD